ncbi:hypothetical protein [Roseinatronobacter sp.]|uniref:hypothetical protein n=1 Tax=Roseinatronobacter sp. TaxID=1945755 RepID=UPI003F72F463
MTFHFTHMAPPGATLRRIPGGCWLRDAQTGKPARYWLALRPAQSAPDALDTPLCALLAPQAGLRAG